MQDEPVGRAGDEPDGERDRHGGRAQPHAELLTGGSLRAREHRLSFVVTATVATSRPESAPYLQGGPGGRDPLFGGPPDAHTVDISLKWAQFPFY